VLQSLAGTPDGAALVVWTGGYGATFAPRPVLAAYRPRGTVGFEAPEAVSRGPEDPRDASAAFDGTGRPVVAWIGRPGYLGEFPQQERSAVRISQRNE